MVAATALYGPQAAALVEMFPTRVRYTAMSFPYHVGTGWVGGFLPVTSFALVAITGNIYEGLWYAVVFTAISVVVSIFFLKETRRPPARGRLVHGHQWMSIGCSASASTRPIGNFELCPSAIARSSSSRFFTPVMVISTVRAERIDGARQRHASDRRVGWHRIGHDPDRPPCLGSIERILQVGSGEDRSGMPVLAHAEPDEVGRPRQILQPGIGRIARQLDSPRFRSRSERRARRSEGTLLAIARTFDCARLSIGTRRSSVGMIVTRFHGSFCAASFGKIAGPVFPPGTAISDAFARLDRAVDDEPDVAGNGIGKLVQRIIFPPFRFDHVVPFGLSRRSLRVSEPSCNRLSASVQRRSKAQPVVHDVAHHRVDRRDPGSAKDIAFADIALRIDADAKEDRHSARPLIEHIAREIASGQHGRDEVRRFGDSVIAASASTIACRFRSPFRCRLPPAPVPGPAHVRSALCRSSAHAGRFARGDLLDWAA